MAGFQYKDGKASIQFTGPDNRRRTIRLNSITERNATRFREKLERLNTVAKLGQPLDDELGAWIAKLGDVMVEKLAEYGLVPRREAVKLGPFLASYTELRGNLKPGSITSYGHAQRNLLAYFGADRLLRTISAGDADEFRLWLLKSKESGGEGVGENTMRRRCTMAAQFFRAAMRKGVITSNPFDGVGGSVKSDKSRMYFLSREDAAKVDAACPDIEWRIIFALARFGGLRTPSETFKLTWDDIDWARGRMLVHSPKTERHAGGAERWVPIFPEIRPLLDEAWHAADEGNKFVIHRYHNQVSLRTRFRKIIKRAGLTPWQKLFHNLRSTRQTELAAIHPLHVVCAWLGNKAAIAAEHYLQVTDADFDAASGSAPGAASALQACDSPSQLVTIGRPPRLTNTATNCDELSPVASSVSNQINSPCPDPLGGTAGNSGKPETTAVLLRTLAPSDAQFERVATAWPTLTDAQRGEIMRVVEQAPVQQGAR